MQHLLYLCNLQASLQKSSLVCSSQQAGRGINTFLPYQVGKVWLESKGEERGGGGERSTSVFHICARWILISFNFWLWRVGPGQLALVNMDVMENPPPVPVRRQKYWHLYTWYRAPSSGQRGRVDQRLRFAKSQARPLPTSNLFDIGQGGLP